MSSINIANMSKRVELIRLKSSFDPAGYESKEWETVTTVWASVEGLKWREVWAAQSVHTEETLEITVRTSKHFKILDTRLTYLRHNGRVFDIISNIEADGFHSLRVVAKSWEA